MLVEELVCTSKTAASKFIYLSLNSSEKVAHYYINAICLFLEFFQLMKRSPTPHCATIVASLPTPGGLFAVWMSVATGQCVSPEIVFPGLNLAGAP